MSHNYQEFRQNPFIDRISQKEKWTVSTNKKVPIDMYILMYQRKIAGATYNNELSLVNLDTLHKAIPNAANYAFYLDALADHIVILDIEPKCPDDIKNQLKQMECLYCETSLSGKGLHMVFELPDDILDKYPDARQKIVFKEEHGYYEILLNHYVTFTANQINANIGTNDTEFRKLFETMAQSQKTVIKATVEIEELEFVDTKYATTVLNILLSHKNDYKKTLNDFNGDHSKYEFSYIAWANHRLDKMLNTPAVAQEHTYTDSERAWFLYKIASEFLPHRAKHDEQRNNMPWLLYLASEVIAHNKTEQQSKQDGDKT